MNSRDLRNYIVSGIYTIVLLAAILLAYKIYVPEKVPPDRFTQSNQSVVNEDALSDSEPTSGLTVEKPQERIDTVYIYNLEDPLIVFANIQPETTQPSQAGSEDAKGKSRGKGEEQNFVEDEMMEAFERAFENVVEQEKKKDGARLSENVEPEYKSVDHGIMSEGMILDETQTRMGNTFFNYFYNHWEPPQEASNFMITIKEKMMPSAGSSVSITIDEELVFQTRLQPRGDYIEQMGQRAVAICYQRLQQNNNSEYFQVY